MKHTELRIGNLIFHKKHIDNVFKVNAIVPKGIQAYSKSNLLYKSDDVDQYKGIPITEECLVEFGFEKEHGYFLKSKMKFNINTIGKVRFHWSQKVTYVDYVHQLQNLYFAITGEELTLKQEL